jgi:hypothetical protein
VVDTVGYINGIFNYAFGSNMTEENRAEAQAYMDANGITAATLSNSQTSNSNIHDGYIDGSIVPDSYNDDAEKIGLMVKTMIEVGVARGYGEDSDASVTNWLATEGAGGGMSVEDLATNIAITAVTAASNINDAGLDDSWATEAVKLLLNNTTNSGSLI